MAKPQPIIKPPKHEESYYDKDQLAKGIEVEMEHTTDREIASQIARTHLDEKKDYYTLLEKVEAKVKASVSIEDVNEAAAPGDWEGHSVQEVASWFHGGQFTELYKLSSSGSVDDAYGLEREVEQFVKLIADKPEDDPMFEDTPKDDMIDQLNLLGDWAAALKKISPELEASIKADEEEEESFEDEEPSGPEEEDYVLFDSGPLGSRTSVSQVGGKFLGEFKSTEEAEKAIKKDMEKNKFYPGVWYQDDHGGMSPYSLEAKVKAEDGHTRFRMDMEDVKTHTEKMGKFADKAWSAISDKNYSDAGRFNDGVARVAEDVLSVTEDAEEILEGLEEEVKAAKVEGSEEEAHELMGKFSHTLDALRKELGFSEQWHRGLMEKHKPEIVKAVSAFAKGPYGKDVYKALEEENYHFLNEVLTELGKFEAPRVEAAKVEGSPEVNVSDEDKVAVDQTLARPAGISDEEWFDRVYNSHFLLEDTEMALPERASAYIDEKTAELINAFSPEQAVSIYDKRGYAKLPSSSRNHVVDEIVDHLRTTPKKEETPAETK